MRIDEIPIRRTALSGPHAVGDDLGGMAFAGMTPRVLPARGLTLKCTHSCAVFLSIEIDNSPANGSIHWHHQEPEAATHCSLAFTRFGGLIQRFDLISFNSISLDLKMRMHSRISILPYYSIDHIELKENGWRMNMTTSHLDSVKPKHNSVTTDDPDENSVAGKDKSRRYLDVINAKGRALNLSRRDVSRERRINILARYSGAPRRKIIDRRESLDDRRADG